MPTNTESTPLSASWGPLRIDVPRTTGYYLGIGAALAFGMIEWPIAVFIAGIPLVKLLQRRDLPTPVRTAVHLYTGAALPVGGDAAGTIQLSRMPAPVRAAVDKASGQRSPRPAARRRPAQTTARAARPRRRATRTTAEPAQGAPTG